MKKIAIIGTGPQWQNAPFDDPTWEIWTLSGCVSQAPRINRLYEIHDKKIVLPEIQQTYPDGVFWRVGKDLGPNFIVKEPYEQTPEATIFDFEKHLKKFGPYFASSVAWLLADAIEEKPDVIALWGVNMASESEYGHQKPSCTFLLGWAKAVGIEIFIPDTSELLWLDHQYAYEERPKALQTLAQKKLELTQGMNQAKKIVDDTQSEVYRFEGALEMVKYFEQNWYRGKA